VRQFPLPRDLAFEPRYMVAATWDQQGFVVYSAALRGVSVKLSKIAGDLILLASGPRAGLAEINLPSPGKVKLADKPGVNGQNDHCGSDREKQFKDSTTLSNFWIAVLKSQLACHCAS
jgi:Lyase